MEYGATAKQILNRLGGVKNIVSVTFCLER